MTEITVLHISTARTWRGGEQQLAYLTGELKKAGVKQYVLCVKDSAVEAFCIHSHIPYFSTEKRSSVDIFFASKIASVCRKNKISLIHTHDSHAHTFEQLRRNHRGKKLRLLQVDNRSVQQRPVPRHLLFRHRVDEHQIIQSHAARPLLQCSFPQPG